VVGLLGNGNVVGWYCRSLGGSDISISVVPLVSYIVHLQGLRLYGLPATVQVSTNVTVVNAQTVHIQPTKISRCCLHFRLNCEGFHIFSCN
jgi:hypothetical protein